MRAPIGIITLLVLIFYLSGCSTLKPVKPDLSVPESFTHQPAGGDAASLKGRWWEDFNDPSLNALIERALKNNHDILLATERVLEERARVGIKSAELFPTIDLQIGMSRQKQTFLSPQSGGRASTLISTVSVTPVASYEVDLWGRISSAKREELARLLTSVENRRVALHTVVSDLITLYFQYAGTLKKIDLAKSRIESSKKTLKVIENRYNRGIANYLDLIQARSLLSESKAKLPSLERQREDLLEKLSLLVGAYPGSITINQKVVDYVSALKPVSPGLPSDLLLRRPDLRAKLSEADAAFNALRVSHAKRFPKISLTGSYGWLSDELRGLFEPSSLIWQLSVGVLSPLFDANRLKLEEEAALSRYRQSLIGYAKTVLQAFYEVETALMKEEFLRKERASLLDLLESTQRAYRASLNRYQRGLTDLLRVLETERSLYQTREHLVDTETALLLNRVFLYRALGGGWIDDEKMEIKPGK